MARRRGARSGSGAGRPAAAQTRGSGGGGAGKVVLGFVAGAAIAAGGLLLYQHTGESRSTAPSVAAPAPETAVHRQSAAADSTASATPHPAIRTAPFGTNEEVFEAGATLYAAQCGGCHGRPGHAAPPSAKRGQQFWDRQDRAAATIIARPAGEIYAGIAAGAPARHMPAYAHALSETQLWDLALLLKSSREDLPDPVLRLLQRGS